MTVNQILNLAIKSIYAAMPEAIYAGSLVKQTKLFDTATSKARLIDSATTPVEIIFDNFTAEEKLGSDILSTDVKLYIIANDVKDIGFYDIIRIGSADYKIKQKIESVVGSQKALFTIKAQL